MYPKRSPVALSSLAGAVLLATTFAGCSNVPAKEHGGALSQQPAQAASKSSSSSTPSSAASGASGNSTPEVTSVRLDPSVPDGATGVKVSTLVSVKASDGTVSKVKLWSKSKDSNGEVKTVKVPGAFSPDGTSWTAASALDPGAKYRLEMQGKSAADGAVEETKASFRTEQLSLDEQTHPIIFPPKGGTVGIGMPVILTFDVAVQDRKEFEKHLRVTSTPSQPGTWHWYGDKTVHFRPERYWKPGTKVTAEAELNGVSAGRGIYGQSSASTSFTVGRSVITRVNLKTKQAKVYIDGRLARSIPVTGGRAGWRSRSGNKLIMDKLRMTRMTNESIGASEEYDYEVPYAMRVTNSGEFLHAAPWKEGKGHFGIRNTSHGCVGMSTANAGWLFNRVKLGDPVITTGTDRGLEQGNGWSDWDLSYKDYQKGSAL